MSGLKKAIIFTFIAVVIALVIFLTFENFFGEEIPEYAKNIAAAFFGSLITMVITAILLNAQSMSELGKEKSVGVFNAKLQIYHEFIGFLNNIIEDEKISNQEIKDLKKWVLKLSLVAGSDATQAVTSFISQTLCIGKYKWGDLNQDERNKWIEWYEKNYDCEWEGEDDGENFDFVSIGSLIHALKVDLGEQDVSNFKEAAQNWAFVDEIVAIR